ncbi:MAG: LGFP repeat-containing protein, partial [Aquihabitans sp.]
SKYSNFENGRIYYRGGVGAITVPKPYFAKHESVGGVHGVLGYPTRAVTTSGDKKSRYQNYTGGRIYVQGDRVVEIHGAVFTKHESIQGVYGPLGYPISDLNSAGDGRGKGQWFEKGFIWYTATVGAHGLWGKVNDRHLANGNVKGYLRYPTSEPMPVGDGRGTYATFERGNIYCSTTTDGFQVHGAVLDAYLNTYGGPTGSLGYPTSELDPAGTSGGRFQQFEGGKLRYNADGSVTLVS